MENLNRDFTDEQIDILFKLYREHCFGTNDMYIDNVLKGFPKDKKDIFRDAVDDLIRRDYLGVKSKKRGKKVFINPQFRKEIFKAIADKNPFLRF